MTAEDAGLRATPAHVKAAFQRLTGRQATRVDRLARGYANVTWLIETDGGRYLLKMPPAGAARVLRTVGATARAVEAGIPTPRIIAHELTGTDLPPYWVQEYIEDAEDAERSWSALSPEQRAAVARDLGLLVGRLHATPVEVELSIAEALARRFRRPLAELRPTRGDRRPGSPGH